MKFGPIDLNGLVSKAQRLSDTILSDLNSKECIQLRDLFTKKHGKNYFVKERLEALFIQNNISYDDTNVKGLYVYGEDTNEGVIPVYIGISRNIISRLRQHAFGKRHNESTLAFLKAKHKNKAIARKTFHLENIEEGEIARANVRDFKVVAYYIEDDYELYFLEVAMAGILDTKWNSFRTH